MKYVKYTGNAPEYCDGFPKDCERSCDGAIHFYPNSLKDITDGEYDYIKKKYPKMRLMLVPKEKPAIKKVKAPVAKAKAGAESKGSVKAEVKTEARTEFKKKKR